MKNTIINEILEPIVLVSEELVDPKEADYLRMAIEMVRRDLDRFFADAFEPDDARFYGEVFDDPDFEVEPIED